MQTETTTKRLFTVDEYYKIAGAGIIKEGERTELINGEIIQVSSMGALHGGAVTAATDFLLPLFKGMAQVRVQLPIHLNQFNEPEPDISLVRPRRDSYRLRHPEPADVLLILEISHTSLHYDREVKLPVYAAARIRDVWIEDLTSEVLLVFRDPSKGSYKTSLTFHRGDSVWLLAFPEIAFPVEQLLGPGPATPQL